MRVHLRTLGTYRGIDIHQTITLRGNQFDGLLEDNLTVHAIGLCRCVWEMITDITHVRCTEEGIADSMQQHVGIAMS